MGLNRALDVPAGTGAEQTAWVAERQRPFREAIENRLALSRLAQQTRRPGQTLQDRTRELETE